MTTETVAKKIDELRVADLKVELEARSLDTHGNKIDLLTRLKKDLVDNGIDPDTHEFHLTKNVPLPKRQRVSSATTADKKEDEETEEESADKNEAEEEAAGDAEQQEDEADAPTDLPDADDAVDNDEVQLIEDDDELIVKTDVDDGDEVVDEVGEVDEVTEVPDFEESEEPSTVSLETSNNVIDNEDSLNLTIGEDEEKIFQDEETDVKPDESSESKNHHELDGDSSGDVNSSTLPADRKASSTSGSADVSSTSGTGVATNADSATSSDKTNGISTGAATKESADKSSATKKDASKAKSTSSSSKPSSGKEDKESSSSNKSSSAANGKSKATSSSSSSSTTSFASRNLWVSGLSSLTRATDLKIIFSKHGKVVGAKVVTNTRTPGTRCYGYVTMGSSADATKCIEQLNRIELHGRIVTVERAKSDMAGVKSTGDSPTATTTGSSSSDAAKKSSATGDDAAKNSSSDKSATDKVAKEGADADDKKPRTTTSDSTKVSSEPRSRADTGRGTSGKRDRDAVGGSSSGPPRRPPPGKGRPVTDREREVLSFQKIREERERQRLRERERQVREEERRRREARQRQREEEERLVRERERLKKERLRLEREKADLLRLERERQKLEREKIELERLELKRQQLKIEEAKRAIKRPSEHDRYADVDRKRPANDRRFEPPPPPRFDTSINSRSAPYVDKKRVDDYSAPVKGRDDYSSKRGDSFKRPATDYAKRDDVIPRVSNTYDGRSGAASSSSKDRYGLPASDSRPVASSFTGSGRGGGGSGRSDDRDIRNQPKSRYVDTASSGGGGDSRYSDRNSGSSAWPNSGGPSSSSAKSFGNSGGNSHIQTLPGGGDLWNQKPQQSDANWRSMDQNQDRYDRTYNERKSQAAPAQYISAPPARQNSFVGGGGGRPQERYNSNMSSRFENGRF